MLSEQVKSGDIMAKQVGINKLTNVARYLIVEAGTPCPNDRLFAVTDAAVIVNARIADLILNNNYGE